MNPEIKQLWVDALRSGEYQQGVGSLHAGDSFCCLGVLCDLYVKSHLRAIWVPRANGCHHFKTDPDSNYSSATFLPIEVMQWADLDYASPQLDYDKTGYFNLATANDAGVPFTEIAEFIEQCL